MSARTKKVALAIAVPTLVTLGAVLVAYARVATGYASLVGAALHFGTGDSLATIRAERLVMPFGLERAVRLEADEASRTVEASFLGLVSQSARWREGLGATRGAAPTLDDLAPLDPVAPGPSFPRGVPTPPLEAALTAAFADDAGADRGTHAVAVLHRGVLVAERYRAGYDGDTPLLGWSMTKSVTATLVARQVATGRIAGFDAPVAAPEWGAGDPRAALTFRQLLRMESGLAFRSEYESPWADSLQMLFVRDDVGAFAASKDLVHAPGTAWSYSDGTSNVLARAVHARSGDTSADRVAFPRRALFEPLGMSTAVVSVDATGVFVGSSLMQASTHDWLRFARLYLEDGVVDGARLLPEEWLELAFTTSTEPTYGAHFWCFDVPPGDALHDVWYAAGYGRQLLAIDRARDLAFVRLGTSGDRAFELEPFARSIVDAIERE